MCCFRVYFSKHSKSFIFIDICILVCECKIYRVSGKVTLYKKRFISDKIKYSFSYNLCRLNISKMPFLLTENRSEAALSVVSIWEGDIMGAARYCWLCMEPTNVDIKSGVWKSPRERSVGEREVPSRVIPPPFLTIRIKIWGNSLRHS